MAAPRFRNEDEAAQYYLSSLRDGTRAEKIAARDGLAAIFSRRGLYEEAAELYELNVRAGVRSPDMFERLSDVYRQLGDHESAAAALAEARRQESEAVTPPPAPPSRATLGGGPATTSAPDPSTEPAEPRLLQFPGPADPHAPMRVGPGSRFGRPIVASARGSAAPALSPEINLDRDPLAAHAALTEQVPAVTARLPVPPWAAADTAPLLRADREAMPEPARQSRSVPTPVLVTGVILFLIVLPVMLLAVLLVNPIALYLEGRSAGPNIDVAAGEPPRLKVAAGAVSGWYVQPGRSVSGLWASPGLELTLDQEIPGAGRVFPLTGPRSQRWGETITIVERRGQGRANQLTEIPATFDAPRSLPPVGTEISGRISGQVTAPRLSESSQFNTTTESIDVPVRLVVVSTPELWLDRFTSSVAMYLDEDRWLLVTIGALLAWCVLAGGTALVFRIGQR